MLYSDFMSRLDLMMKNLMRLVHQVLPHQAFPLLLLLQIVLPPQSRKIQNLKKIHLWQQQRLKRSIPRIHLRSLRSFLMFPLDGGYARSS